MFVQYMIPAEKRYPYPIVMVHGGGAQGTHMMGLGGGRAGCTTSCRPATPCTGSIVRATDGRRIIPTRSGRATCRTSLRTKPLIEATNVFKTGQWPGPGGMDDPFINQFMACESGNTSDEAFHSDLVWPGGVELVDRIGPCILHGHAFGGFFGWGVADRRPNLVKGIMCMEINGNPFERQLRWGLTAGPMTYDPPVGDLKEFKLVGPHCRRQTRRDPSRRPTSCRRSRRANGRTCSGFRSAGSRASSAPADRRSPTSHSSNRSDAEWRCCGCATTASTATAT